MHAIRVPVLKQNKKDPRALPMDHTAYCVCQVYVVSAINCSKTGTAFACRHAIRMPTIRRQFAQYRIAFVCNILYGPRAGKGQLPLFALCKVARVLHV